MGDDVKNPPDISAPSTGQHAAAIAASADRQRFDVCNGDADGLCAVLQWRLQHRQPATLITGLKRDIALLQQVPVPAGADAAQVEVLVCDLSLQRNLVALLQLLDHGARVSYFDHHAGAPFPVHPALDLHIVTRSDTCTSLLMDQHLQGRWRSWALVGAYGDNLAHVADRLSTERPLDTVARAQLRLMGEAINYNAYGEELADVHIAPHLLYARLAPFNDPLQAWQHEPVLQQLAALKMADLRRAQGLHPYWRSDRASVLVLPDAPWSRRVIGCLANELAGAEPQQAHAVLKAKSGGSYTVSVRAPMAAPAGADVLCGGFGGSGRAAAAGIDALPAADLHRFVQTFAAHHWG
jgi:hypothetical protein